MTDHFGLAPLQQVHKDLETGTVVGKVVMSGLDKDIRLALFEQSPYSQVIMISPVVVGETMKAVVPSDFGGPDVLQLVDLPIPTPGPGELLVRIMAFSVNPVDTKIRQGKSPYAALHGKDKPLGFDASGVVAKRGPKCKRFDIGDAVMYTGVIGKPGTYAQYSVVDERIVGRKPKTLTFTMAAGLPLVSLTAWEALVERLALPPDPPAPRKDSIMIINASGGVGTMATQIARRLLRFETVIATAGQPHTIEWCKQFYATHCVSYRGDIKAQLSGLGLVVNNIMMCYSPDVYLQPAVDWIEPLGRIACIVESDKGTFDEHLWNNIMNKSLVLAGELMFTKPLYQKDMDSQGAILDTLCHLVEEGRLIPPVYHIEPFSLESLRKVHATVESGKAIGKLVFGGIEQ